MGFQHDQLGDDEVVPDVSVIMATYNRPSLVRRAVESLRMQTYGDWEFIIVDDASSTEVVEEIASAITDQRIRLIRRPANGGPSAARNTGLAVAKGRFLAFLDDDDEFHPHKLARQVEQLQRAPAYVTGTLGLCVTPDQPLGKPWPPDVSELRREQLLDMFSIRNLGQALFRGEAARSVRFDESLPFMEDWDYVVRTVGSEGRLLVDNEPVMSMNYDATARVTQNAENVLRSVEELYSRYEGEIVRDRHLDARWRARIAYDALRFGHSRRARRHAMAAVRRTPGDLRRWYLMGIAFAGDAPASWMVGGYRRFGALRRRLAASRLF